MFNMKELVDNYGEESPQIFVIPMLTYSLQ